MTLTKTKFGKFPEYHNSSDNLKITDPQTLQKSYNFLLSIINEINKNQKEVINKTVPNIKSSKNGNKKNKFELKIFSKTKCEPFLSKRKLYRTVSDKLLTDDEFIMFNTLYYGDGIKIKDLSKIILKKPKRILNIAEMLKKNDLIELKF